MSTVTSKANCLKEVCEDYIGQKVACICTRYQYRGILANVAEDCITLSDAVAVEISGPCNAPRASREDPIGGVATIRYEGIEIFYQPHWVHAPLPSEDGYRSGQEREN